MCKLKYISVPDGRLTKKEKYDNLIHHRLGKRKNISLWNAVIKLRKFVRGFPDDVEIMVCEVAPTERIFRILIIVESRQSRNGSSLCRLFVYVYILLATNDKRFNDLGIFGESIFSELKVGVNGTNRLFYFTFYFS